MPHNWHVTSDHFMGLFRTRTAYHLFNASNFLWIFLQCFCLFQLIAYRLGYVNGDYVSGTGKNLLRNLWKRVFQKQSLAEVFPFRREPFQLPGVPRGQNELSTLFNKKNSLLRQSESFSQNNSKLEPQTVLCHRSPEAVKFDCVSGYRPSRWCQSSSFTNIVPSFS